MQRRSHRLIDITPDEQGGVNVCAICLEPPRPLAQLDNCRHCFCFGCISEWAEVTNLCPLCKAQFYQIKARHRMREVEEREQGWDASDEDDYEESSDSDFDPREPQQYWEEEALSFDALTLSEEDWSSMEETPEPSSEIELLSDSV